MDNIKDILEQRGKRYGGFRNQAAISQNFKLVLTQNSKWHSLSPDKKEALEMITSKIARILNGDPNYKDSWKDIEGYAKLISDTLTDD